MDSDVGNLEPSEFLNDTIIDFYIKYGHGNLNLDVTMSSQLLTYLSEPTCQVFSEAFNWTSSSEVVNLSAWPNPVFAGDFIDYFESCFRKAFGLFFVFPQIHSEGVSQSGGR